MTDVQYNIPDHEFSEKSPQNPSKLPSNVSLNSSYDLMLEGNLRNKTILRKQYEIKALEIRQQIGELEVVRQQLGLSARRLCQILMVDPSSWSRWNKNPEQIPPHIWQALQWYLMLQKNSQPQSASGVTHRDSIDTHNVEVEQLRSQFKKLENAVRVNKIAAIMIGFSFPILAFALFQILKSA